MLFSLFESLKEPDSFLYDSSRYLDAQICWNITEFSKEFYQAQNFSCLTSMFLMLLPCTKRICFVKQNNFLLLLKKVDMLNQNANSYIVNSIIVPQWKSVKLKYLSSKISTDWAYQTF